MRAIETYSAPDFAGRCSADANGLPQNSMVRRQPVGMSGVGAAQPEQISVQSFPGNGRGVDGLKIHKVHGYATKLVVVFPGVVPAEGQIPSAGQEDAHLGPGTTAVAAVRVDLRIVASSGGGQCWGHVPTFLVGSTKVLSLSCGLALHTTQA